MATGIYSWSQTASSDDVADSTINWAEGQAPSSVNNSARAMMAVLAKWRDDISGVQPSNVVQTTAGTANAQTLTTNGSIAALTNGWTLSFKVGAGLGNTGAVSLAVDGLAAKNIQGVAGADFVGGELVAGSMYTVTYSQPDDKWLLKGGSPLSIGNSFTKFTGPATTAKTFTLPNASATILTSNAAVTVAQGGTGLTSGTSGGIPYFSSTSAITSSAALTANAIITGGGAGASPIATGVTIDGSNNVAGAASVASTGKVSSSSSSAGVGYSTGAGSTVTQLTNKSTGVTINTVAGKITTANESMTNAQVKTFTVTNSSVAATDTIVLSISGAFTVYLLQVCNVAAGSFQITIYNTSSTLSDAIPINFAVIKAVQA